MSLNVFFFVTLLRTFLAFAYMVCFFSLLLENSCLILSSNLFCPLSSLSSPFETTITYILDCSMLYQNLILCPVVLFLLFLFLFVYNLDNFYWTIFKFINSFFLRKISPVLTAANPPLLAEKYWPWANIRAHLPLLYMWDAHHSMAAKWCHVHTQDLNQRMLGHRSGTCALNHCATGPAP